MVLQISGLGKLQITDGLLPFGFNLDSDKNAFSYFKFPEAKYLRFWSTNILALVSIS